MIIVRPAALADAAAVVEVLRRSISQLCVLDHLNDPVRLQAWLGNKTIANVSAWINSSEHYCVVALIDNAICGFGMMMIAGEVMLCYVDPDARFRGVSDGLLNALEQRARSLGLSALHLGSTKTARRFYEERGFIAAGAATEKFANISCQSMVKRLGP